MQKEKLFPGLAGEHRLPDGSTVSIKAENDSAKLVLTVPASESTPEMTFEREGKDAEKDILEIDYLCRGGYSPNQALAEWIPRNIRPF